MDEKKTDLTGRILAAAIEVQKHLGAGFKELTYENAMAIELKLRGIVFRRQLSTCLFYKGESIGDGVLDLLVDERVVVELKAVPTLNDAHKTQVLAYLRSTGCDLGLLLNFHSERVGSSAIRIVA